MQLSVIKCPLHIFYDPPFLYSSALDGMAAGPSQGGVALDIKRQMPILSARHLFMSKRKRYGTTAFTKDIWIFAPNLGNVS